MSAAICACDTVVLAPGQLAKSDPTGAIHSPERCTSDVIVVDAPTLAEGLDKLRIAVAEQMGATA